MAKEACPFCRTVLPKHSRHCSFGNVPSAEKILDLEQRTRQNDLKKLTQAITDPNKHLMDGGGNHLRDKLDKK